MALGCFQGGELCLTADLLWLADFLKLTCWVGDATPPTLELNRARVRQIGETEFDCDRASHPPPDPTCRTDLTQSIYQLVLESQPPHTTVNLIL